MKSNILTKNRPLRRFWGLLSQDKKEIQSVYFLSIFNGLVNLSLPLGIQSIVSFIQTGQITTSWIVLLILVVFGIIVTGILQIYQLRITENLQQRVFTRAAFEFAFRVPRIKMESMYQKYGPELMNRFFDTVSVQKGLPKLLIDFSTAAMQITFGLLLLCFYHPFFIFFTFALIVTILVIIRFTASKGLETSINESSFKYQMAHWLQEVARTATSFKLAGNTDLQLKKTNEFVKQYLGARNSHFRILVQQYSLMVIFKVIIAAGLLGIGGYLVIKQQMNIGQFVASEILILLIISSIEKLILCIETIYDVLTGLEKIGQVTDLELDNLGGIDISHADYPEGLPVELNNVSFKYPKKNTILFKQLDLKIEPGAKILITGVDGSGKSTLLHLLAGLYDIQSGSINYGGISRTNYDTRALHSVIGDCITTEKIFPGTVLENITMGRPNATLDNVKWAIKNLGMVQYINKLPNGLNTLLDNHGKSLPQSIAIKLILARSIADRPRLLLIEDMLELLQEKEMMDVISFLTNKENKWTLVSISSDIICANAMDYVVELKDGFLYKLSPKELEERKIKEENHA